MSEYVPPFYLPYAYYRIHIYIYRYIIYITYIAILYIYNIYKTSPHYIHRHAELHIHKKSITMW